MRSGQLRREPFIAIVNLPNITSVPHTVGAAIGGKRAAVMIQRSGLGNAVRPLTSLTHVFRIPLLLLCTHRGAPGVKDEPGTSGWGASPTA